MIKAVLFDLDDTLIISNPDKHFPVYLQALSKYGGQGESADRFCQWIMDSFNAAVSSNDATKTLSEKFISSMSGMSGISEDQLNGIFTGFYRDCYDLIRPYVGPRPGASEVVDELREMGIRIVIATNPALPRQAIQRRMEWGGLSADDPRFELVTSLEEVHFGKPRAEYYEEIMLRLALSPGEALMVGDNLEADIKGAREAGLPTYYIQENTTSTDGDDVVPSGAGSFEQFAELVKTRELDSLLVPASTQHTFVHRLEAFPSAIDNLIRTYRTDVLECPPTDNEWSARDIICHLKDHENAEDRARLERIITEDMPFLSGNYDPWSNAGNYKNTSSQAAFQEFAANRSETVKWLESLSPKDWARSARHAIFGPTSFLEMVRFTSEHDLTHLKQMLGAIGHAVEVCG